MRFEFIPCETLPRLAWCAEARPHRPLVAVLHGTGVETRAGAFAEGAWSGNHADFNFVEAAAFCGSGAVSYEDRVRFATSTDTLQAIFSLREADRLLVSNSALFLLAMTDDRPDLRYRYYEPDLMSIMRGLNRYVRRIPTARQRWINIHYHCNLNVSSSLEVSTEPKPRPGPFRDFDHYFDFLGETVRAVIGNGRSPARKRGAYRPLATVSSGYDSPACAVLARDAGCSEAVTFTLARPEFESQDDSGAEIARILGLSVSEHSPEEYLGRTDFPEVDFLAAGTGGDDVILACLESKIRGSILITGFHGDKIWERVNYKVSENILRGDPSGASMHEFRLRTGFINLPVPFLAVVEHPSIHAISNSPHMARWSVGGPYDRPIPRRIAEDAGVPRALFGQKKKAVARPAIGTEALNVELQKVLSPASLQEFARWSADVPLFVGGTEELAHRFMNTLYRCNLSLFRSERLKHLLSQVRLPLPYNPLISARFSKRRTAHSVLFHWAAGRTMLRYVAAARQYSLVRS